MSSQGRFNLSAPTRAQLAAVFRDPDALKRAEACFRDVARPRVFGVFTSSTTQAAAAINTPTPITLDAQELGVVDPASNVGGFCYRDAVNTSRVYITQGGIYNFQFSLQLDKTTGGVGLFYLWPRINGVDVPNSASRVRIQGNDNELIPAWNFVLSIEPGDYFELVFAVDDTSVQIQQFATTAFCPATPSVILTVTDNIGP